MDKIYIGIGMMIGGFILLVLSGSIGSKMAETKVISDSILDPKTGEYYKGYKEVKNINLFLVLGVVIGAVIIFCGIGVAILFE